MVAVFGQIAAAVSVMVLMTAVIVVWSRRNLTTGRWNKLKTATQNPTAVPSMVRRRISRIAGPKTERLQPTLPGHVVDLSVYRQARTEAGPVAKGTRPPFVSICVPLGFVWMVRLQGPLTLANAPQIREYLEQVVADGHRYIVLDFSDVTQVDSSGLGSIISGLKAVRLAGGDMRLSKVNEQTARLMRLTGLDRVLTMHPSIEDATAVYQAPFAVAA